MIKTNMQVLIAHKYILVSFLHTPTSPTHNHTQHVHPRKVAFSTTDVTIPCSVNGELIK